MEWCLLPHGMQPFATWDAARFSVPVWQAVLTYTWVTIDIIDVEFLWMLVEIKWQWVWLAYSLRTVLINTVIVSVCYCLKYLEIISFCKYLLVANIIIFLYIFIHHANLYRSSASNHISVKLVFRITLGKHMAPKRCVVSLYCYHYNDVIMDAIASQITSLTIVYSTVYSDADQRKHQSFASLAFVRGIHREPVNSPHKWPVTRRMFPFDDVIMAIDHVVRGFHIITPHEIIVIYK